MSASSAGLRAGAPSCKQDGEVGAVGGAIAIQVSGNSSAPASEQHRQIISADRAVAGHISWAIHHRRQGQRGGPGRAGYGATNSDVPRTASARAPCRRAGAVCACGAVVAAGSHGGGGDWAGGSRINRDTSVERCSIAGAGSHAASDRCREAIPEVLGDGDAGTLIA